MNHATQYATALPLPGKPARRRLAWLRLWGRAPAWSTGLHVGKVVLAALLALLISMALDLESPRTAMFCVFLVMQAHTGLVFQKSFFRLLGTLVGGIMSVLLIGAFAQTPELFLPCFALWIAACTAGSFVYRNFQSYGFVLAGYTVCFVALPAIEHPERVFDIATTRMLEMLIGVMCAAVVSDTIFPQRMAGVVRNVLRQRFANFCAVLAGAPARLRAGDTDHSTMLRFAGDALGLEAASANAALESSDLRRQRLRLQLLNHEFMGVSSTLHALHQMLRRQQNTGHPEVATALHALYQPFSEMFATAPTTTLAATMLLPPLTAWRESYADAVARQRQQLPAALSAEEQLDFATGVELLQRLADEFHAHCITQAAISEGTDHMAGGKLADEETLRFSTRTDPLLAALAGLRGVSVMALTTAVWLALGWSAGVGSIMNGVASGTVFATLPSPAKLLRQALFGWGLAVVIGLIWNFWLIPQATDWVGLGLLLIPPLALAAWLAATPQWAGVGAGLYISFILHCSLDRSFNANLSNFLDASLADFFGFVAAATFYTLIDPNASRWSRNRIVKALRQQMVDVCHGSGRLRREVLESSSRDLIQRIATKGQLADTTDQWVFDWLLTVLEIGRAAIDLRAEMDAADPAAVPGELTRALRGLSALFAKPSAARRQAAVAGVEAAIAALADNSTTDATHLNTSARRSMMLDLHFIRSALIDQSALLDGERH